MDPAACLYRLIGAIKIGDFPEAVAALNDYYRWRLAGGFEPRMMEGGAGVGACGGDKLADLQAQALADAIAK